MYRVITILEDVIEVEVEKMSKERVLNLGDIHAPFHDKKAISLVKKFIDIYKPHHINLNGDIIDFYSISRWDKDPARKISATEEVSSANYVLDYLLDRVPKKTNIYINYGNHDLRMRKYIWEHPELEGFKELELSNMLHTDKRNIKVTIPELDYWRQDSGHLVLGDTLITHGDNTLNGCKGGINAGYNTMKNMGMSTIINHTHRLNIRNHISPYHNWVAIESGCLCQQTGTADWQQGFTTFEIDGDKSFNYQLHPIEDGKLYYNGKIYKGSDKW